MQCDLLQFLNFLRNGQQLLISPGIFRMYLSIPFFRSPKAPITTGIVVAFIPHIRSISISRSLYLDSFSFTFTEVFLSVGMAISMSRQLFSFLFLMTMSGLLAFISRSVCIGMSHKIVMSSFSDTVWGSCSYHFDFVLIFQFFDDYWYLLFLFDAVIPK